MGFFDFFKFRDASNTSVYLEHKALLDEIIREVKLKYEPYHQPVFTSLDSYKALTSHPEILAEFVTNAAVGTKHLHSEWKRKTRSYSGMHEYQIGLKLIGVLLRSKITFTVPQLKRIAEAFQDISSDNYYLSQVPTRSLLRFVEQAIVENGLSPEIKGILHLLKPKQAGYTELTKLNDRIKYLLAGAPEKTYDSRDPLGVSITESFRSVSAEDGEHWKKLFNHCLESGDKNEPSQKWIKQAEPLVEEIGREEFARELITWLDVTNTLLIQIHKNTQHRFTFLGEVNHNLLKGLIWCAGIINHADLNNALDEHASLAYKKKPGHGPVSARTGTACMCAFAMLPMKDGVPRLSKFKTRIRNNTVLKSINRFMRTAAKNNDVSEDQIEELSVPDFGITDGKIIMQVDTYRAVYNVAKAELLFEREGKYQKAVPAVVKDSFAAELKKLKSTIKEITSLLPVIENRIERSYIRQKIWPVAAWKNLYKDHPLTSLISRNLIWHFSNGDRKGQGFILEHEVVDAGKKKIEWIDENTTVQLWHPIGFSRQEVLQWRAFLQENQIIQPFKQAYREVYLITDAELNTDLYSNRFAAHILRQHQFAALCRQRGWRYTLMGTWDSHNTPYIDLAEWNIQAQFYVNSDWQESTANEMGIFNFISTDQVRFIRENAPLPIRDVPAMVFTEIMRDVDLFVGVTSIGNDPQWQDGGNQFMNNYWHSYSFSDLTESARIRSEVLQSLIPRLKIASRCSFDKKFLIVKGKLRTYKIHMGSGNILMEPNDQYLCIVPESKSKSTERVFLPFEGDNLMSIIISKALLLADDDKITDTTILTQINR